VRAVASTLDVNKKVRFEDEFELVVMRWRYLMKSPNPNTPRMEQFEAVLGSTTRKIWRRFKYAYGITGYDMDDVKLLGRVHLVSYLGLFGLLEHPDKLAKFVKGFKKKHGKEPTEQDILRKDRANCSSFLYQRLEEVAKICAQKNRNIRGTDGLRVAFVGDTHCTAPNEAVLDNPERYGLKKLTKKATDEMYEGRTQDLDNGFVSGGRYVRVVEMPPKALGESDATELFHNPHNSLYLMNPHEAMEYFHENVQDDALRDRFESMEADDKRSTLARFIKRNADNPKFAEEVKTAREMLRGLA
jgi:hypothetical protein